MKISGNANASQAYPALMGNEPKAEQGSESAAQSAAQAGQSGPPNDGAPPESTRPDGAAGNAQAGPDSRVNSADSPANLQPTDLGVPAPASTQGQTARRIWEGLPDKDIIDLGRPNRGDEGPTDILRRTPGGDITGTGGWTNPQDQLAAQSAANAARFGNGNPHASDPSARHAAEQSRLNSRNGSDGLRDRLGVGQNGSEQVLRNVSYHFSSANQGTTLAFLDESGDGYYGDPDKDGTYMGQSWADARPRDAVVPQRAKEEGVMGVDLGAAIVDAWQRSKDEKLVVARNAEQAADAAEQAHKDANQAYLDAYEAGEDDTTLNALSKAAEAARKNAVKARLQANEAKKKAEEASSPTGRTSGTDYDRTGAPNQETLDRAEAKKQGLVNPAEPTDRDRALQAAAERIAQAARLGWDSVARPTGEDTGQEPSGPIPDKHNPVADPFEADKPVGVPTTEGPDPQGLSGIRGGNPLVQGTEAATVEELAQEPRPGQ